MTPDVVQEIKDTLHLIPEVIGTAAAIFVVVLLRQLTAWLTAWIALQNVHMAAQTGISRALSADPTLTDEQAIKAGAVHVIHTMKDSLSKTGGEAKDLIPILESKIPEARSRIADEVKPC